MDLENLNLVDEQGNQLSLRILNTFSLEDKHYAIMVDMSKVGPDGGASVYVLKMELSAEGNVEFVAPDEADMPEVIKTATDLMNNQEPFQHDCGGNCSGCSGCGSH